MATIIEMKNPNKILNRLAIYPMTKMDLKKTLKMDYPRVSEAMSLLEKGGYATIHETLTTERGKPTGLYGLTFKGATTYLSSITFLENPYSKDNPTKGAETEINQPKAISQLNKTTIHLPSGIRPLQKNETIENYQKQQEKERKQYQKELEELAVFLETYGNLLNYPLFSQIRWLKEKYGDNIFRTLTAEAKIILDLKPFPLSGMVLINNYQKRVNDLRKQKWLFLRAPPKKRIGDLDVIAADLEEAEQTLEILRSKEYKWWRMGFAARVADQLCGEGRGDMYNEVLADFFAEVAEFFRRLEVEPAEKMTQIFSAT
jgi:hypothetical protein